MTATKRSELPHTVRCTGRCSLDVVTPVFNERECVQELVGRMEAVRVTLEHEAEVRVIVVDDGSSDGTSEILGDLAADRPWLVVLTLTRNFGHQSAVTAGLDCADADYVAIIDGDLQDPPELLGEMLAELQGGEHHIVYGQRIERIGDSRFKRLTAAWFYRFLRHSSGLDLPLDTGDFRVMEREVVEQLCELREHNRFLRGMVPWLGYSATPFPYVRQARHAGETKYPVRRMLALAINAVIGFSPYPIRVAQALGLLLTIIGCLSVLVAMGFAIASGNWSAAGFVLAFLPLFSGLGVLATSMVGGYVYRIHEDVKGRPLYVLDRRRVWNEQNITTEFSQE